jgi:hypothetical protein
LALKNGRTLRITRVSKAGALPYYESTPKQQHQRFLLLFHPKSISDDKKDSQDCYDLALKNSRTFFVLRECARSIAVLRKYAESTIDLNVAMERNLSNFENFDQKRKI